MTDKLTEAIDTLKYHINLNGSQDWFLRDHGAVILDVLEKYNATPVVSVDEIKQTRAKKDVRLKCDDLLKKGYNACVDHLRATYPNGLKWEA